MNYTKDASELRSLARAHGVVDPEAFCAAMPRSYFECADPADFRQHELFLNQQRARTAGRGPLRAAGDVAQVVFHDLNVPTICRELGEATRSLRHAELFYRTFVNRREGFVLHAIYGDPRSAERVPLEFAPHQRLFLDDRGRIRRHVACQHDSGARRCTIRCVNVAHKTMLSNLWETLESHDLDVELVEVWRARDVTARITAFYEIRLHTSTPVGDEDLASLSSDFERYLQRYAVPMSVFDLVGPSMVGPSSSHTAGANRIGQIARSLILATLDQGERIDSLEIRLLGSFRDTGVGHRTPSAIGGGLQGLATDDGAMIEVGDPERLRSQGITFGAQTARFLGFTRGGPEDDARYAHENSSNIAEIVFTTDRATHIIAGFSIGGGNVEIRAFDGPLERPITGKGDLYLDAGRVVERQNAAGTLPVVRSIAGATTPRADYVIPVNTMEELVEHCRETGQSLIDVVLEVESGLQGTPREAIFAEMRRLWTIMDQSVSRGIANKARSLLGLSGDGAERVHRHLDGHPLFDNLFGRATAYAIAVNEINARSGVIVACPTAGSCGILPGILRAYVELSGAPEERILESLLVSGFLGMLLFNDVSTAGADYGCQAEIGSAAAMAAAALAYLEGGDPDVVTQAIKNSLGLICDPVAGLVEVPCVKRNGVFASLAISAALLALSGVRSAVSPDEVILTMREVGERINADYKETARAGLAKTRDGKRVERLFECEVQRFFGRP
jgi:L-serine dehydratase